MRREFLIEFLLTFSFKKKKIKKNYRPKEDRKKKLLKNSPSTAEISCRIRLSEKNKNKKIINQENIMK